MVVLASPATSRNDGPRPSPCSASGAPRRVLRRPVCKPEVQPELLRALSVRAGLAAVVVAFLALLAGAGATPVSSAGHEAEVRVAAQRLADGRMEFSLQQRGEDGGWGERVLPTRRFFPARPRLDRWLSSSPLTVRAVGSAEEGHDTDVRVAARRLDDGRTEFALQVLGPGGEWGERVLPRHRFFPAVPRIERWLTSSPLTVAVPGPTTDGGGLTPMPTPTRTPDPELPCADCRADTSTVRVARTGGDGVAARNDCRDDARTGKRGLPEGTPGQRVAVGTGRCDGWSYVKAGPWAGWIRDRYLAVLHTRQPGTPDYVPTSGRILGDPDAPVRLVAYEDFLCAYCRQFTYNIMPRLKDEYVRPGLVAIEYRHMAGLGQVSVLAAAASECASDQGLFWPYHDLLLSQWPRSLLSLPLNALFMELAGEVNTTLFGDGGLDLTVFQSCLEEGVHIQGVLDETQESVSLLTDLGARRLGTPTFVLNARLWSVGAPAIDTFRAGFDRLLADIFSGNRVPYVGEHGLTRDPPLGDVRESPASAGDGAVVTHCRDLPGGGRACWARSGWLVADESRSAPWLSAPFRETKGSSWDYCRAVDGDDLACWHEGSQPPTGSLPGRPHRAPPELLPSWVHHPELAFCRAAPGGGRLCWIAYAVPDGGVWRPIVPMDESQSSGRPDPAVACVFGADGFGHDRAFCAPTVEEAALIAADPDRQRQPAYARPDGSVCVRHAAGEACWARRPDVVMHRPAFWYVP